MYFYITYIDRRKIRIYNFLYVRSTMFVFIIICNTPVCDALIQSGFLPNLEIDSRMIYTILIGSCAFISVVKTSCFMWLYTKKFCCNFKPYHKNKQTNIHILIITKEFEIITQTSKSKWELKRGKSCNFLQKFLLILII